MAQGERNEAGHEAEVLNHGVCQVHFAHRLRVQPQLLVEILHNENVRMYKCHTDNTFVVAEKKPERITSPQEYAPPLSSSAKENAPPEATEMNFALWFILVGSSRCWWHAPCPSYKDNNNCYQKHDFGIIHNTPSLPVRGIHWVPNCRENASYRCPEKILLR